MPKPIANWSTTHDCWLTPDDETESLFSVPSAVFSETFPTSGMTLRGVAYALPTWEPPMGASGYLSSPGLLPTPQADTSTTLQHGKPALQAICIELTQTAPREAPTSVAQAAT